MEGWESWHRQTADGAVESHQGVVLRGPVVQFTCDGPECLGDAYWREVERVTWGLVRPRERNGALELRLFGHGPALLRFGRPTLQATESLVRCSYPIEGGLLARRPGRRDRFCAGWRLVACRPLDDSRFLSEPGDSSGGTGLDGALYSQVQSRVHVAISRRYFARLIKDVRR